MRQSLSSDVLSFLAVAVLLPPAARLVAAIFIASRLGAEEASHRSTCLRLDASSAMAEAASAAAFVSLVAIAAAFEIGCDLGEPEHDLGFYFVSPLFVPPLEIRIFVYLLSPHPPKNL